MSGDVKSAIEHALRQDLARDHLPDFASLMDPNYIIASHVKYLCGVLEALERGEIKNLIVLIPPRHGKTRLVSEFFPSWWMGRHTSDELILASNTSGLAEDNSGKVRNLVMAENYPFDARVSTDTFAKDLWRTTQGGVIRAAGVGSSIQGRGGNLLICDDPIAGVEEATETAFERQWRWFTQDFFPRRLSDSHVILSMFRWGDRDLAGRVLEHDDPDFRNDWTVVSLPAYAREGDSLGREPGEVLWPPSTTPNGRRVGYDKAFLETQRKADSRVWAAQYELDPVPAGGVVFKADWLQRYDVAPHQFERVLCGVDAAAKTGIRNDFSAIVKLGVTRSAYYVLDVWRAKVEFPVLLRRVQALKDEAPAPSVIYVEDTSNATAMIQALRLSRTMPIVAVQAKGTKVSRVEAITGLVEAKKLFLPREAPWLVDFERELLSFPAGKHDDQVDALTIALSRASLGTVEWGFAFASTTRGAGAIPVAVDHF